MSNANAEKRLGTTALGTIRHTEAETLDYALLFFITYKQISLLSFQPRNSPKKQFAQIVILIVWTEERSNLLIVLQTDEALNDCKSSDHARNRQGYGSTQKGNKSRKQRHRREQQMQPEGKSTLGQSSIASGFFQTNRWRLVRRLDQDSARRRHSLCLAG